MAIEEVIETGPPRSPDLVEGSTHYLFSSHDGYGLGHVRRNTLIASAVLAQDPTARVVLVTGVGAHIQWPAPDHRIEVVRVPSLLKGANGDYRSGSLSFSDAIAERTRIFDEQVRRHSPDVVVVDRHPYGTSGELRPGLERARQGGARLVLGLRDVLDAPEVVADEIAGKDWRGVGDLYHTTLVYGGAHLVDHVAEYGLPMTPEYCGWVVGPVPATRRHPGRLAISAGGGGDGAELFHLGRRLVELNPSWHGVLAAGPYTPAVSDLQPRNGLRSRLTVLEHVGGCGPLFAGAEAVLCMAGYNSTLEALAAGRRPLLVPRRSPRREQAIRAGRLAALGLAHVVDQGAAAREVGWFLGRDHAVGPVDLARAGIRLDGAERAARTIVAMAHARSRR